MAEEKSKRATLLENVIGAVNNVPAGDEPDDTAGQGSGILRSRMDSAARAHLQQRERRTFLRIPADRCRVWPGNPRKQELLNESVCADLISSFQVHGQKMAAIVRPLHGEAGHDFEVIVGTRRRWTAQFLGMPLLVEVQERLADDEAYALARSENDDRIGLSQYEDALGLKRALTHYYRGQLNDQARFLGKTPDYLSRYLDLADMPEEIVDAYPGLHEIRINHIRVLKPLLDNPRTRKQVIDCALTAKGRFSSGAKLVTHLLAAAKPRKPAAKKFEIRTGANKPLLNAQYARGQVTIRLNVSTGATDAEMTQALKRTIAWIRSE